MYDVINSNGFGMAVVGYCCVCVFRCNRQISKTHSKTEDRSGKGLVQDTDIKDTYNTKK